MTEPTEITQQQVDELTAALNQETLFLLYRQWRRADGEERAHRTPQRAEDAMVR
jgi:hypothetical protein